MIEPKEVVIGTSDVQLQVRSTDKNLVLGLASEVASEVL